MAKRARERVLGRAHARLDQDQVPAPPGVRDRRLHRAPGLARPLRRAAPRRLRRATKPRASSTSPRSAPASTTPGSRRSGASSARSPAPRRPSTRARPDRPRPPLGRAAPRLRGALHRLDRRRRPPPPDLPRPARRQEARGVPARGGPGRAARRRCPLRQSGEQGEGASASPARPRGGAGRVSGQEEPRLKLTNLKKVSGRPRATPRAISSPTTSAVAPLLLPYLRDRPAGAHALSRRHQRQVVLPEGRARLRAGLGAHRAHLLAGHGARHRLLRRGRRGVAALRGQPRHDPAPPLGVARPVARAAGLAGPRPRPQGRAVHRRGARSRSPCAASSTSSSCRAT